MKKLVIIMLIAISMAACCTSCNEYKATSDSELQNETELLMRESNRQVGMPGITRFQAKKTLKWIYELEDRADLVCHAYFFNEMTGQLGDYIGPCLGYGVPYSAQYSNPDKVVEADKMLNRDFSGLYPITIKQPEPNGIFKPEGMSATWVIFQDPKDGGPMPMYIEPTITVSPWPLHKDPKNLGLIKMAYEARKDMKPVEKVKNTNSSNTPFN